MLAAIFTSVNSAGGLSHRELIDSIITLNDSVRIQLDDGPSKSKIRGVLALLKHSHVLRTSAINGKTVRLLLSDSIASFEKLREQLDSYLFYFANQNNLAIPMELWAEIIWKKSDFRRIDEAKFFVEEITSFYEEINAREHLKPNSDDASMLSSQMIDFSNSSFTDFSTGSNKSPIPSSYKSGETTSIENLEPLFNEMISWATSEVITIGTIPCVTPTTLPAFNRLTCPPGSATAGMCNPIIGIKVLNAPNISIDTSPDTISSASLENTAKSLQCDASLDWTIPGEILTPQEAIIKSMAESVLHLPNK